jgi:hypothetical protein
MIGGMWQHVLGCVWVAVRLDVREGNCRMEHVGTCVADVVRLCNQYINIILMHTCRLNAHADNMHTHYAKVSVMCSRSLSPETSSTSW